VEVHSAAKQRPLNETVSRKRACNIVDSFVVNFHNRAGDCMLVRSFVQRVYFITSLIDSAIWQFDETDEHASKNID
jgi:hypothetical protein